MAKRRQSDPIEEIQQLAGDRAPKLLKEFESAVEALNGDRDADALPMLKRLARSIPASSAIQELLGITNYHLGNFRPAIEHLEQFRKLSGGSVDLHPVLMDCYRAQKNWLKVDTLWRELAEVSPSADLVTEGRIVFAGSLADRGELNKAIATLEKRSRFSGKPPERQLRLWYALADLHDKAGNAAVSRDYFQQVLAFDPDFFDATERLAAL